MPYVTNALFAKILVALLAADEAAARDYLGRQRAAHMGRIRELTRAKTSGGAVGDVVAADYAIAHLDADLRWLETTLGRVRALDAEVRG